MKEKSAKKTEKQRKQRWVREMKGGVKEPSA